MYVLESLPPLGEVCTSPAGGRDVVEVQRARADN
jgi:hypothetical protein